MRDHHRIPRRTLLKGMVKGMAVGLGLPFLEAMVGSPVLAAGEPAAAAGAPVRFMALFFPNGVSMKDWRLAKPGPLAELSPAARVQAGAPTTLSIRRSPLLWASSITAS